jgi:Na+-transporting methylmalonyl-CoA/oxaloacetate decarboxylase gamma subunit
MGTEHIGMMEAIMSALFVMLVVFIVLVILYLLMKLFTSIVRVFEANIAEKNDGKEGGA